MKWKKSGFVLIILFLSGCGLVSDARDNNETAGYCWDTAEGWTRFSAGDTASCNHYYWLTYSDISADGPFSVSVETRKTGGAPGTGFGLVFCRQPDDSCYNVIISLEGRFSVHARDAAGNYSVIQDWTVSEALLTDYDQTNLISIEYSAEDDSYLIVINDQIVTGFAPQDQTVALSGGDPGFVVFVGSEEVENFPDEPVEVYFRMLEPVVRP
ncbi:MAG: hypothetical protein JW874_15980 [Spirochaetales bacterium]|nr:hypothetical protein [Spirochaetales bacterium]